MELLPGASLDELDVEDEKDGERFRSSKWVCFKKFFPACALGRKAS